MSLKWSVNYDYQKMILKILFYSFFCLRVLIEIWEGQKNIEYCYSTYVILYYLCNLHS